MTAPHQDSPRKIPQECNRCKVYTLRVYTEYTLFKCFGFDFEKTLKGGVYLLLTTSKLNLQDFPNSSFIRNGKPWI